MSDQKTKNTQKRTLLKQKKREILLSYLGDPENEVLPRYRLAKEVLHYRQSGGMYRLFTPLELDQIEAEALDLRRRRFALALMRVDDGLLKRAADGDPAAAKLCFQRYEGWEPSEKKKVDVSGELRAQIMREILDELGANHGGFEDLFRAKNKE